MMEKQKIKKLLQNSLFIDKEHKKYWLSKLDNLNESILKQLLEILESEKKEFSELLKKIQKYDPEGKILEEFKKLIARELKKIREYSESEEKNTADEDLEEALKNV